MAAKQLPPAEYLRECFDYDPGAGILTWKVRPPEHFPTNHECSRWNKRHARKEAGTVHPRSDGRSFYRIVMVAGHKHFIHRIIWKMKWGVDPLGDIDHKDGDGLNNRPSNLRPATHSQNMMNARRRRKDGRLRGASFHKAKSMWIAQIMVDKKTIHLGAFETQEDAHAAYCRAAAKIHGEFARFS